MSWIPTRLNPELGTEADLEALHAELSAHGMGIVLDIVPNHMATSSRESGVGRRARPRAGLGLRRLVRYRLAGHRARAAAAASCCPILGDRLAEVVRRGEITLEAPEGVPRVRYFEHDLPLDPSTLPSDARPARWRAASRALHRDHPACGELAEIAGRAAPAAAPHHAHVPPRSRGGARAAPRAARPAAGARPAITRSRGGAGRGGRWILRPGETGERRLRRLLDAQVYRLAHWRRAAGEINYRRFFDVNDLVALHMEDPEVFAADPRAGARLAPARTGSTGSGSITPTACSIPLGYFQRLAAAAFPERAPSAGLHREDPDARASASRRTGRSRGPRATTSSTRPRRCSSHPAGYAALEAEYRRVIRRPLEFTAIARQGKRLVLETALSAGVRRLADRLLKLRGPAGSLPRGAPAGPRAGHRRDHRGAAGVPHVRGRRARRSPAGRIGGCWRARSPTPGPGAEPPPPRWISSRRSLLGARSAERVPTWSDSGCGSWSASSSSAARPPRRGSRTPPSTLTRRCSRATRSAAGPRRRWMAPSPTSTRRTRVARRAWPGGMLAVTTHDTKRTADVRSRLDVLSEIPDEWAERVAGLAHAQPALQADRARPPGARPRHRPSHPAGDGRHLAARAARRGRSRRAPGAGGRIHGEGGARGEAAHHAGPIPTRNSRRRSGPTSRPCWLRTARPGSSTTWSGSSAGSRRAGLWNALAPHGAPPRLARHARSLSGRRAVELRAGGSRQPAAGGLRAAAAAAGRSGARALGRRSEPGGVPVASWSGSRRTGGSSCT